MNLNILEDYLVRLGVQVDRDSFGKAKEALGSFEKMLSGRVPASALTFVRAAGGVAQALLLVDGAIIKTIQSLAKADLQYQLIAQRMFISVQAAEAFTRASEGMGNTLHEIAWNAELKERYFDLVERINQLQVPPEAKDMFRQVRNISHEFTRLKVHSTDALKWIAAHLLNLNQKGLAETQQKLRAWVDYVVDKIPIWTKKVADFLETPLRITRRIIQFLGDLKDAAFKILTPLKDLMVFIWNNIEPWQRSLVILAALIIAAFSPIVAPILAASAAIAAFILVLDDFYTHMEGGESSKLLKPLWEFVDFINYTLTKAILGVIVIADHMWHTIKGEAHPSGKGWLEDLKDTMNNFEKEWWKKKYGEDVTTPEAQKKAQDKLFEMISMAEGTTFEKAKKYGFENEYGITVDYGKWGKPSKPVEKMTYKDVLELQDSMQARQKEAGRKVTSSAYGKFQAMEATLKEFMKDEGIRPDEYFGAEAQKRFAIWRMKRQGNFLEKFLGGKVSGIQAQRGLAGIWMGIPDPDTGKSRAHDMGQKAAMTTEQVQAWLADIKGRSDAVAPGVGQDILRGVLGTKGTFMRPEVPPAVAPFVDYATRHPQRELGFFERMSKNYGDVKEDIKGYADYYSRKTALVLQENWFNSPFYDPIGRKLKDFGERPSGEGSSKAPVIINQSIVIDLSGSSDMTENQKLVSDQIAKALKSDKVQQAITRTVSP